MKSYLKLVNEVNKTNKLFMLVNEVSKQDVSWQIKSLQLLTEQNEEIKLTNYFDI